MLDKLKEKIEANQIIKKGILIIMIWMSYQI